MNGVSFSDPIFAHRGGRLSPSCPAIEGEGCHAPVMDFDLHWALHTLYEAGGPNGSSWSFSHFREGDVHVRSFGGLHSVERELKALEVAGILGDPCN